MHQVRATFCRQAAIISCRRLYEIAALDDSTSECPLRVKTGNALAEQNISASPKTRHLRLNEYTP